MFAASTSIADAPPLHPRPCRVAGQWIGGEMSAFGGKAGVIQGVRKSPLIAKSGHAEGRSTPGKTGVSVTKEGLWTLPGFRVLPDHVGCLLGDHDDGRIGIAAGDCGHDRSIDDPDSAKPSDTEAIIYDRHVVRAHFASSDGVKNSGRHVARCLGEFVVGLRIVRRHEFLGLIFFERRLGDDAARKAN